jgi:kynurenine formamidase
MQLIDLSVDMFNGMPNHKAFPNPVILTYKTHEQRAKELGTGFSSYTNYICMMDHSGTHADAPIHFNPKGVTIDAMPLDTFYGPAVCWDLTYVPPKGIIDVKDLEEAKEKSGVPFKEGDIVLLNTGHHNRTWPHKELWERTYPGLTYEATKWFSDNNVKIHGVEGPSTDHPDDTSYPNHRACRDFGITHIECLANLEKVVNKRFTFIGFPLKLVGTSGAPLRAVALLG